MISYGALWSISVTPAPTQRLATYEAAYWFQLTIPLGALASVAIGAGLMLQSWAAWNSKVIPN